MNDLICSKKNDTINEDSSEKKIHHLQQETGKVVLNVEINWNNNQVEAKRVGLGFTLKNNYVVVSKCEPLSYAEEIFKLGDKILSINEVIMKTKEDARNAVIKHLKEEGRVKFKIERDLDEIMNHKKIEANEVKEENSCVKSMQLNSDCRRICGEAIEIIKKKPKPLKGQLIDNNKTPYVYDYNDVVKFEDKIVEKLISCDTEGKKLKKIAPKVRK
uniref:PDZ domain-containing protein n=1 Tax=Strongyloides venezuelensis TaxID=75913 RepID=A0A0K0FYF2_STRVS